MSEKSLGERIKKKKESGRELNIKKVDKCTGVLASL